MKRWDWESAPCLSLSNTKHYHWSDAGHHAELNVHKEFVFLRNFWVQDGKQTSSIWLLTLWRCNKRHFQTEAENFGPSVTDKKPMQPLSFLFRSATDMEAVTGCRVELSESWVCLVKTLAQFVVRKYKQAMNLNFPYVHMQPYWDSSDPCLFGMLWHLHTHTGTHLNHPTQILLQPHAHKIWMLFFFRHFGWNETFLQ